MPHIDVNGARLHYTDEGAGPETILFSHGLLFSGEMFGDQIAAFSDRYRCVTWDHRGQGQSDVTVSGYDMESLTQDAEALIERLGLAPCHFVGLSMGGFIGMRLAARRPELVKSLTLIETSADPEPVENHGRYRRLNFVARWFGLGLVVGKVMPIMFGKTFLKDPTKADARTFWRDRIVANRRIGITRAVTAVIERRGVADEIDRITRPTLILVGDEDVATVPEKSRRIQAAIPGAELKIITGAGHSSTIEQPEAVNAALEAFLAATGKGAVPG